MILERMQRDEITLEAPAKINLGLEVIRRRADGFHDLNTIFGTVDLCDRVILRRKSGEGFALRVIGDERLAGEGSGENLCVRAARLLLEECGLREGVEILLEKHIPVGAGLGGGSSDAAATLVGLIELFDLDLDDEKLHETALSLGSDVPFFLRGGIAHAGGQGEVLRPLDVVVPWSVLLVNPGVHVPTPEAYRLIGREGERPATDLVSLLERAVTSPSLLRGSLVNDFEEPVVERWPEIATVYDRVTETSGVLYTGMSGSGSTIFGLYETEDAALTASFFFGEFMTHVGRIGGKREEE